MVAVPPPGNEAYWNKKLQFFIIPESPLLLFALLLLCSVYPIYTYLYIVCASIVRFYRLLQLKRLTKSRRRIQVKDRDSLDGVWQQLRKQVGNDSIHLWKFSIKITQQNLMLVTNISYIILEENFIFFVCVYHKYFKKQLCVNIT